MGKKGDFDYRYNAQISVEADHQIIVGEHLSQNANDKQELAPALEQIEEATGRLPDKRASQDGTRIYQLVVKAPSPYPVSRCIHLMFAVSLAESVRQPPRHQVAATSG